jgi:hypothetical protein
MIRQCCVCRVNGSAVAMEQTDLPGDWRCRDEVGCRRRVRGKIQSAQLAAEFNDAVDEVVDEVGKTLLGFSLIDPRKR